MILPKFDYLTPKNTKEACSMLNVRGEHARVVAGGTDLFIRMKDQKLSPRYLVGLKNISDLSGIDQTSENLKIGSAVTLNTIAGSSLINQHFKILSETAFNMANNQIRNLGTIGGNLCNAARSADMGPPLIALQALAEISDEMSKKVVPLENFFTGFNKTALKTGEILTSLIIPLRPHSWGASYAKLSLRGSHDIASVGVAAAVLLDAQSRCSDCRVILGAVAPTPMRVDKIEEILKGQKLTKSLLTEVGKLASKVCRPISDVRCSANYRSEMVAVMTRKALESAFSRTKIAGK